jgi:hypothetical protein
MSVDSESARWKIRRRFWRSDLVVRESDTGTKVAIFRSACSVSPTHGVLRLEDGSACHWAPRRLAPLEFAFMDDCGEPLVSVYPEAANGLHFSSHLAPELQELSEMLAFLGTYLTLQIGVS